MGAEHCNAAEYNEPTTSGGDNVVTDGPSCDPLAIDNPNEVVRNPNTITYIYRQDVVRSKSGGRIGIVTEVAGDSDSDSSDSDDEDEDEEEEENDEEADNNEDSSVDDDGNTEKITDNNSSPLPADQVRVLWLDESETTQNIDDVTVVDRGFLHGDFVASASDATGQVGVVVDVNISVDLLTTNGSVVSNVSARDLKRVRDFTVGDYVVYGPWLGRIDDVLDNVTVLFDDGSICKVMKADPLHLKPVGKNILEDGHFPYYPGQRVKASSSSVFKNSRWLSGLWKATRLEGTVTKVTVGSVFIYWIASAGYGPDSSTTPAEEQSPKNLKLLSCFAHANWQLGDWCLFPSAPIQSSSIPLDKCLSELELHDSPKTKLNCALTKSGSDSEVATPEEVNGNGESMDVDANSGIDANIGNKDDSFTESSSCGSSLSVSKEPAHETWPLHRKKLRKVVVRRDKKTRKKEENFEKALLIFNTKTRVDVAWQDGTVQRGLDSITLIPIDNPGDHEFVSEQYVVEKAVDDGEDTSEVKRVGVVKSVNAKERTTCVRWLKSAARPEDPKEFDKEEVVSVYELEGHPDYDYCYGDVVVRLSPVSVPAQVASADNCDEELPNLTGPNDVEVSLTECLDSKKVGVASHDEVHAFADLSWVGNITGLRNGDIEVTWADGMISTVGPQAIYVVGRDDDDQSVAGGGDISDDAASWETLADDEAEILQNTDIRLQNDSDFTPHAEDSTMIAENSGRNGPLSFPLAAFGFVTRFASGIFSRGRKHENSSNSTSESENEQLSKMDPGDESSSQKSSGIDESAVKGERNAVAQDVDLLEAAERICKLNPEEPHAPRYEVDSSGFKGFDIVKDPYDHYYLGASGETNAGRKWLKKVQQDWNILQNNLPVGIYVRVYEDRMDLMRAVIVGAYGTPYQNGLFFFDFHLPPEYPDVPPSAYYHSGGWRINPNLYEEGKVCLSLLNTWTGRGNEVWDPSSSSILQVLVSLQGLVLNSKPYFNEAGYDKQVGTAEGEKNSLSYNENTFLLNCKTMMHLMRRPPKDFEDLVREHFRKRGYCILKACDAYMKGYLIGSLTEDASICDKSIANANSVGFKLMLTKIVPKLFVALNEAGADIEEFKHLQQS